MIVAALMATQAPALWLTIEGQNGPGKGKHIVLLAGDEEYRSEEGLPQLAKILARRHGFKCTVLFSINDKGEIDPNTQTNQPGMEALDKADLCIMLLRFRHWPDTQMKHFVDFYERGKPIIGLRTSTHAFAYPADSASAYKDFGWQSQTWPGGFGKQVLGENWVTHWGDHGRQATRSVTPANLISHPLLNGVYRIFGTTDVYEAAPPPEAQILLRGEVVEGMKPEDSAATNRKKTVAGVEQPVNDPMMPIAWSLLHKPKSGKPNRIVTTTMGAATDLLDENLRRFLVNSVYWTLDLRVPAVADVDVVGKYEPSAFGFNAFKKGAKPADLTGS